MNRAEARRVLALRDAYARWKAPADPELLTDRATVLAQALPTTPAPWAMAYVADHAARHGDAPTDGQIIAAWREHRARVDPEIDRHIRVVIPDPPRSLPGGLWPAWNRARVAALRAGATPDEAVERANAELGVEPDPPIEVDVAAAKAAIRARAAALAAAMDASDRAVDALMDQEVA